MGSLADNRTSTSRTLFGSLSSLELVVIIALKRLVDRKVVPCQAEAIWKEYEAHVRQHPNMTYKYSRDVLHKVRFHLSNCIRRCHRSTTLYYKTSFMTLF